MGTEEIPIYVCGGIVVFMGLLVAVMGTYGQAIFELIIRHPWIPGLTLAIMGFIGTISTIGIGRWLTKQI